MHLSRQNFSEHQGQGQANIDVHLAKHLIKTACHHGGEVEIDQTQWQQFCTRVIPGMTSVGSVTEFLDRFPQTFEYDVVDHRKGKLVVRPKMTLELCQNHCSRNRCKRLACGGLHCCKFFLMKSCKFKEKCKYGHDLSDTHNKLLLRNHMLDDVTPSDLGVLLKISHSATVLPKVCKFYNVDDGCRAGDKGEKCPAMHVCKHYLMDDCTFGRRCKRSHNIFDPQPKKILEKHGIRVDRSPKEVLVELRQSMKQQTGHDSPPVSGDDDSAGYSEHSDSDDSLQGAVGPAPQIRHRSSSSCSSVGSAESGNQRDLAICMFFLREKCNYKKVCKNKHPSHNLPYQWQYESCETWKDFQISSNDEIEFNFCDPNKDECFIKEGNIVGINFDLMKYRFTNGETGNVRRLSTPSDNGKPPGFKFLTHWCWYWQDDERDPPEWIEFGTRGKEDISSDDLEEEYTSNPNVHLTFSVAGQAYVVDFQTMKRKSRSNGKVTNIRRRPEMFDLMTKNPIRKNKTLMPAASPMAHLNLDTVYPKSWDLNAKSDNDFFQIVSVRKTSEEYDTIQKLFNETVTNLQLKSVKRIQNAELWEAFYRKQRWMEKKLSPGHTVNTKRLFHGTKDLLIDAICQQGFDWRMSGSSNATRLGKGSYFARDAIYSIKYAVDTRRMFVVQVLVGAFAKGNKTMVRPPPKDERRPLEDFYDSVVDDLNNPSIFVVFSHEQAYPEYLIEY